MKASNLSPEVKVWSYIFIMLGILLLFSCGAKTKSSSETELKENATQNTKVEDQSKKTDSLKVSLTEQAKREFSDNSSESSKTEATRTTTTEITETRQKPPLRNPDDYRPGPNGKFINDATGEIITTHTKIVIEEKFNEEMLRLKEVKFQEEEKRKKDSIANKTWTENKIIEHNEQLEKKLMSKIDTKDKKQWEPSLKLIFGVLSFLTLLLVCLFSWLKYSSPFSWIFLLFKRKKPQDGSAA